MKRRCYTALMVVLPLFVGSGATTALLVHFFGRVQDTAQSPAFMALLAVAGMGLGITNLWRLIEKAKGGSRYEAQAKP